MLGGPFAELGALSRLAHDWNGYGSPAPSRRARFGAYEVIGVAMESGKRPDSVRASAEGGVAILFFKAPMTAGIEVANDGTAAAVFSDGCGKVEAWEIAEAVVGGGAGKRALRETLARIDRLMHASE
jgi:hypothetical protein